MNKEDTIKKMLTVLQVSEGEGFTFDEEGILQEYKNTHSDRSSLAIKALSILGGFLATLAFIGFLLLAGLHDSDIGLVAFGIVFIGGSILLNKKYQKLIIDTSSISVFVTGFFLLGIGLHQLDADENFICLLFIILACISLATTHNPILAFISVLIVNASLLALITFHDYNLFHVHISFLALLLTYFMLHEAKIISIQKKLSHLYNPIRTGLMLSLLIGLACIGKRDLTPISLDYIWISSIAIILSVVYLISFLLIILEIKNNKEKIFIYSASILLLVPTAFSPAISGAILIILVSFLVNYKMGLVLGIIAFTYFISQFYYDLNFTLLVKSIILFLSGILFILFYLYITKIRST